MEIRLLNIEQTKNKISCKLSFDRDMEIFFKANELSYEYNVDISNVPKSILIIPLMSAIFPIAIYFSATLVVDEIDENFLQSIWKTLDAYRLTIPFHKFGLNLKYNNVVKNVYEAHKKAVFFSCGIDAMCSLINHKNEINDLISVWGSDIDYDDKESWDNLSKKILFNNNFFDKSQIVIRTNARAIIDENQLERITLCENLKWWHDLAHGVFFTMSAAPLAFVNGYNSIYIGSSFTKDFSPICASNPLIDNSVAYGCTKIIHDGFEFDRCDKVDIICKYAHKKSISFDLCVCYSQRSGKNCGKCEKCIRTYLNILATGNDPSILKMPAINDKIIKKELRWLILDEHVLDRIHVIKRHSKLIDENKMPSILRWINSIDFDSHKGQRLRPFIFRRIFLKIKRLLAHI